MYINSLYIQNVRNIQELSIQLAPGLTHLIGANGQGKTAILETIHLLTIGRSFRTHQIKELISFGNRELFIEGKLSINDILRTITLGYDGVKRIVSMNGETLLSSSLLFGSLLSVTSTPNDSDLIFGTPSERRLFIDEQIAQVDSLYVYHIKRLHRALQQRNALLKDKSENGIEAWEDQIAKSTAYICRERYKTMSRLIPFFQKYIKMLLELETCIEITYTPSVASIGMILQSEDTDEGKEQKIYEYMKKLFVDKRANELKMGTTLYGPQRDDFTLIWRDGALIKTQASLGQAKAISLALRIAEWELLYERSSHGKPLFLLDDIHSFLDDTVINAFLHLTQYRLGQVIITSNRPIADIPKAEIICIEKGKVQETSKVI